jgi:glycosyltransferase involved in cell wall biosynthesis
MKIVHISAYYIEDLAKGYQVYELVREQILLGHEVHIVTSDRHNSIKNYVENTSKIGKNETLRVGKNTAESGAIIHRLGSVFTITGRLWWKGFKNKIIELNPDFIIVHGILEFQSLRLLFFARNTDCRIIFDDHTTINVVRRSFSGKVAYSIFRTFFASRLYKIAHKIIGVSDSCITVLNKFYGLNGDKVKMIPLGSNISIYYPDTSKREAHRATIQIKNDEILVVYTGKIYDEKKVHLIVEALNDKVFKNKKLVIQIVGTVYNDYKEFLNLKIKNSIHRIILTPNVSHEELAKIYNGADICVWPAHTTTSTLDASACGCPIICTDYKSERYKNNNGFGIKDGDLIELTLALQKIIIDEPLRKEMGQNGITLISQEYTWKKINKLFLD